MLLDAVLVSLADHGLTPTVLAARLTYTGAPESLQGAVAAGLLGAGTVFLGVVEDTAVFLDGVIVPPGPAPTTTRSPGRPRTPSAPGSPPAADPGPRPSRPQGRGPAHAADLRDRGGAGRSGPAPAGAPARRRRATASRRARPCRSTAPASAGAALADLGFPPAIVRGFALLARTAGLVAHLAEEMARPLGMPLFLDVERRAQDA